VDLEASVSTGFAERVVIVVLGVGDLPFKGNEIFVINADGTQNSIETKEPISSFCISRQGVVAAVLEAEGETKINIYSADGSQIAEMKCTMIKSGYPIDVSLSKDGVKLAVSYIRIENGELKSSVAFYNFGEVGRNEIDNYVSGYDYVDTVIPKVQFINDDTAFALGDNRFTIYKGAQKPVSTVDMFLTEEVQSVYYGDKTIALVFRDSNTAGCYRVDVYDQDGKLKLSQSIAMEYTDIALKDDRIVIYNDMNCQMYRLNGKLKYDGMFNEPMTLVVPQDSATKWTMVNKTGVQAVRLK